MPPIKPCIVLVAAPDCLHEIAQRLNPGGGDVLAFTDADTLRALHAIAERRPSIVVLEQRFASTSRGTALIERIKGDPHLLSSEIRVVMHDGDEELVTPAREQAEPAWPLDPDGTRRSPRFPVDEFVEAMVDGTIAAVVNLSAAGAELVSTAALKPNQRVLVSLSDEKDVLRFNAAVAWSTFEIPRNGGPRYRAGLEFLDANPKALDAYSQRHRAES